MLTLRLMCAAISYVALALGPIRPGEACSPLVARVD